jgi:hypothetical protein
LAAAGSFVLGVHSAGANPIADFGQGHRVAPNACVLVAIRRKAAPPLGASAIANSAWLAQGA